MIRKTVCLLILGIALSSCSKESNNKSIISQNTTATDSVGASSSTQNVNISPKEINLTTLESMVSPKTNDTLYVTNFFATWCPPCMAEIPHFTKEMNARTGQKIKFQFISLDDPADWDTKVKNFTEKHGLGGKVYLMNGEALTPEFYQKYFKTWAGESIPFTVFQKNGQVKEVPTMLDEEELTEILNSFQ